MRLDAGVTAGQEVDFCEPGGTLALADAAGFAGTIENFGACDAIDPLGLAVATLTYVNGTIALLGITFTLAGLDAPGMTGPDIALVADGAGSTLLQYDTGGYINAPAGTAATSATWNQPETGSAGAGDNWVTGTTPAAGALQADAGALTIGTGLGTLAGTLEGDGEIMLGGSKILRPGGDIVVATVALIGTTSLAGNLFVLGASFSNTGSPALDAGSAQLGGTLERSGELALAGSRAGAERAGDPGLRRARRAGRGLPGGRDGAVRLPNDGAERQGSADPPEGHASNSY